MILLIAIFFTRIYNNPVVESICKGIRPAVAALIVVPVITTAKSAHINLRTVIIPIAVTLAISLLGLSPVYCIILGALGGYIYYVISQSRTIEKGGPQ